MDDLTDPADNPSESNKNNLNEENCLFPLLDYEDSSNTSSALTEMSSHSKSSFSQPMDSTLKQLPLESTLTAEDSNSLLSDNELATVPMSLAAELAKLAPAIDVDKDKNPIFSPPPAKKISLHRTESSSSMSRTPAIHRSNSNEMGQLEMMFEYLWPPTSHSHEDASRSQEWFMIQEVVSEVLQVKSFKRKYPDIFRRSVDGFEKDWLLQHKLVPTNMAELGLTALRSEDVLILLSTDYPHVQESVTHLLQTRRVENLRIQQKEQYESARIERNSAKLLQARQKALKSAQEFNRRLITERIRERRYYWDLQTQQIHVSRPRTAATAIRPHRLTETTLHSNDPPSCAYPVALLPGQFADYYRRYTSEELFYMPVNTAFFCPPRAEMHWVQPVNNAVTTLRQRRPGAADDGDCDAGLPGTPGGVGASDDDSQPASIHSSHPQRPVQCTVCQQMAQNYVRCTDCKRQGHPTCLDLPEEMLEVVKTYPWSCMECKRCVECADPGHEASMLFCDRCDRGYHLFCVGLKTIPKGQWQCAICTHKQPRRVVITTGE